MHQRPRHLTAIVAMLAFLAVLLPGLSTAAQAGISSPPAPTGLISSGGYRSVTLSFKPAGAVSEPSYEVLVDGEWVDLPTTSTYKGAFREATVRGLGDGESFTPAVRADYGDGVYSQTVYGDTARTTAKPPSVAGDIYTTARELTFVTGLKGGPGGYRITADAVKRGVPTRSIFCATIDGCKSKVAGLRKGQRYDVKVEEFNQGFLDGKLYRLFADPQYFSIVAWDGPQAPRQLEGNPRDGSAGVAWVQPDVAPGVSVTSFQVKVGKAKRWTAASTLSEGNGAHYTEVEGLQSGRTYTIAVRGIGPDGKPGLPASVKVTPSQIILD